MSPQKKTSLVAHNDNRSSKVTAIAAGAFHTIVIRDGIAVAFGSHRSLPRLPQGSRYISVAASLDNTMLLRSDGHVVSCGDAADAIECSLIPSLPHGMMYTSIATGGHHAILLRSDGEAFAFGHNGDRRCDVPLCTPGTWYTSAAAGLRHSLLLRNDGRVIALGCNQLPPGHLNCFGGPCDVPNLPPGVVYCKSLDSDGDMMHRAPKVSAKSERVLLSMSKNAETHQVSKSKFAITENTTSSPYAACLQYVGYIENKTINGCFFTIFFVIHAGSSPS